MIKVIMPRLSVAMKDGTIVKWFKKEGEMVEEGEVLAEIETEKVTDEIKTPASGVLRKILAPEGSRAPVGELIAIITEPGEEIPLIEEIEKPVVRTVGKRVNISPLARKLAEEHKIDLTKVRGTGPEGQIVKDDVLRAIKEAEAVAPIPAAPSPTELVEIAEVLPLTGMRKTIAERLTHSYREAPHVVVTVEVDMTETKRLRQKLITEIEGEAKFSPSYTDIVVKAAAAAIKKNPIINSTLESDQIKILKDINIGVAVALEDGLIVPVIRNADQLSLRKIASCMRELTERARQRRLSLDEVSGGTFTISNLGMFGVDTFSPIINPPQSAILGVGAIKEKPLVVNGQISIRPVMTLSLVFDHRVFNGVQAATFLKTIKEILEKPTAYMDIE